MTGIRELSEALWNGSKTTHGVNPAGARPS